MWITGALEASRMTRLPLRRLQVVRGTIANMAVERGFDSRFLTHEVEIPKLATDAARADLRRTRGGEAVRHCTHFSLSMSASRRFCRWVAWNIDGANHVATTGDIRNFKDDPEYEEGAQVDEDLYVKNDLDQGHIAAFADVSWGTVEEAARARAQSCFFTNITPQLDSFNRSNLKGVWGALEASIAEENDVEGRRISVFGGPIFDEDDVSFKDALVPRAFWKVVAYVEDGVLKAKAFVLTQNDLEGRLEKLVLGEYRMHQRRVSELASKLELDFGVLETADTAPTPRGPEVRAEPVMRRIVSVSEINVAGW
jgi:endonuclease G